MAKVICTRPNAALLISGVAFTVTEDQTALISEDVSDEVAESFTCIPGYTLAGQEEQGEPAAPPAKPKAAPAKAPAKAHATPAKAAEPEPAPAAPAASGDDAHVF